MQTTTSAAQAPLGLPFGYKASVPMLFSDRLRILLRRLVGDPWGSDYSRAVVVITVTDTPWGYAAACHRVGLASIWTGHQEYISEASPEHAVELLRSEEYHAESLTFARYDVPELVELWDGLSCVWIAESGLPSPVTSTDYTSFDHFAQKTIVGGSLARSSRKHRRAVLPRVVYGVFISDR